MNRHIELLTAWVGVFIGSLLWDAIFGDGIQGDDFIEAFVMALLAAAIQWRLRLLLPKKTG